MKNLHVFTNKFPFIDSGEDTFLISEMTILSKDFNIIFYVKHKGTLQTNLPFKFKVCQELIYKKKNTVKISSNLVSIILKELVFNPQLIFNKSKVKELMVILSDILENSNSFLNFFLNKKFNINNDIFYTYWFDEWNNILCYARKKNNYFKKFKLISRTHGFDLYDYRSNYYKIPFRKNQLNYTDKIISISFDGYKYLINKYPILKSKFSFSRLGTDLIGQNPFNYSDTFVIVSCSSFIHLKRIDRIVKLLSLLKIKVKWYHFGGGPLFEMIKSSTENLEENISVKLLGKVNNNKILNFYSITPINLFINLSESEGIPVSIMEAISFSIPVIATDVGGVSEIVTEETGLLFNKNPNLDKIAELINNFSEENIFSLKFRTKIYNFWKKNYNSKFNFQNFSNKIKDLHNVETNERVC